MKTRAHQLTLNRRGLLASGSDWSGITGLLAMVQRAVDGEEWFGKPGHFVCGGGFHAQVSLMRLLTYCAVTGAQTAEEISGKLGTDSAAKALCLGEIPDASTLLRFAETQADAMRRCVAGFWKLSSILHFGQRNTPPAPADDCVAARLDRWLDPVHAPAAVANELTEVAVIDFCGKMP